MMYVILSQMLLILMSMVRNLSARIEEYEKVNKQLAEEIEKNRGKQK